MCHHFWWDLTTVHSCIRGDAPHMPLTLAVPRMDPSFSCSLAIRTLLVSSWGVPGLDPQVLVP